MNDLSMYNRIYALAVKRGVRIAYKNESRLMRFLGTLLFFNPRFMSYYTTTLHKTVYFPNTDFVLENPGAAWRVLAHELIHAEDSIALWPIVFGALYLFPQCLAGLSVLALFGFWNPTMWWFGAFLLALLPWPAPGRKWAEMRGYGMSISAAIWSGYEPDLEAIAKQFTGPAYFWMWPFKGSVMQQLQKHVEAATKHQEHLVLGSLSAEIDFAIKMERKLGNV